MGEYIQRSAADPNYVPESKGMSAEDAQKFMAITIAQQSGRSIDDVMAFLKAQPTQANGAPALPAAALPPTPLENATLPLPPAQEEVFEEEAGAPVAKAKAAPRVTKDAQGMDEVITETLTDEEADDATLEKLNEEEFEEFDGKIRLGSKVVVTYDPPGGRIRWKGRKGTVTRIIGNEQAKVFEIEFPKGKFPFTRRNKKTGRIEKGYQIKKIRNTFDAENIELAV